MVSIWRITECFEYSGPRSSKYYLEAIKVAVDINSKQVLNYVLDFSYHR